MKNNITEVLKYIEKNNTKVIFFIGPTASGKSEIAHSVALSDPSKFEIVNSDSFAFYRDMNIGTAKPIPQYLNEINYHLVDFIEPNNDNYTLFEFQKDARNIISELLNKDKVVLVVGGSGLYINSLYFDYLLQEREVMNTDHLSTKEMYNELINWDESLVEKLHINNEQRIISTYIDYKQKGSSNKNKTQTSKIYYEKSVIFEVKIDREECYRNINERAIKMIKDGLIDEVKFLKEKGITKENISQKAIGYKETWEFLDGKLDKEDLINLISKNTRNFAKRQWTWFNNKLNGSNKEFI